MPELVVALAVVGLVVALTNLPREPLKVDSLGLIEPPKRKPTRRLIL
jgi:hypothetical protein